MLRTDSLCMHRSPLGVVGPHSVWKSLKKSHSTLRAKRATFTFWVAKSSLKMPKWSIWRVFENSKIAVKQRYQTGHFSRTKINEKCQNIKGTFIVFLVVIKVFVVRQCYQTVFIGQNWWKTPKFKYNILSNFQTLCKII